MIEHHLQKKVIADLVECETARFADLKPNHIDSNVFTYHLQVLLKQKFITKTTEGTYELTNKGKLYGINSSLRKHDLLAQAHSIILLSVRDENRWLLRRRSVQPLYGKIGFIHGEPIAGETILAAANRILHKRTELKGALTVKGSGYVCLSDDKDLVSYSHFTLLEANNLQGTLKDSDAHGDNLWLQSPDFSSGEMIPSMQTLVEQITKSNLFFLDLSYRIQ